MFPPTSPRSFLVCWFVAAVVAAGWPASLTAVDLSELRAQVVATGIVGPTAITHAGDARLFITRKDGAVLIYDGRALLPEPFLDISDRVLSGSGERGLFSIAFHPAYAANGYIFAYYTDLEGDVVISRFSVSEDPDVADPGSEAILLEIVKPLPNHNGGQLQFGPDGYLYLGPGDGGGENDPTCQAQDRSSLLGKLLRLDVDAAAGQPPYYAVPPTNPFVGDDDARGEIWAYGLRNPWRFSFDRATGDLYVADVGQSRREEVSFQPAASPGGENYGWVVMEGNRCTDRTGGCDFPVPPCDSPEFTDPILVYEHDDEVCAVIGGYVYRGSALPELDGVYFYGDLCSGQIWGARRSGDVWEAEELPFRMPNLTSFGEDAAGELYFVAGAAGIGIRAGAATLCLNDGRFRVTTTWRTADGQGAGRAVDLTDDAGYFWFFGPENPELFVKVLDGCFPPFNAYWVFAAGLTDVGVTLTVEDTETGEVRVYENPLGRGFDAIREVGAFATCP